MCDGNDGNSSKSITFTRTCVPYYIHVRKKFKKSGVIPVIRVTDLQGFPPRRHDKKCKACYIANTEIYTDNTDAY